MPTYETVVVVKPQLSDAEIGVVLEKAKKLITGDGGGVLQEDRWGRRKLSYPIQHCREGFYVYLKYQAPPSLIRRLEGHFKIAEDVLRTLVVRQELRKAPVKKKKSAAAAAHPPAAPAKEAKA